MLVSSLTRSDAQNLALDRGISGAFKAPSAYFMKSPPEQYRDDVARRMVEEFIEGKGRRQPAERQRPKP